MRQIKLYGTGSATANAVAQVTIPSKSILQGVQVAARINSITDGAQVDIEVSRSSAREIATNSAQQAIVQVALESNFVTSGLSQTGVNQFFPTHVPLDQGQIVYLHALVAGTVIYDFTAILHLTR